jgi:phage/plasmid-associated DNA primase
MARVEMEELKKLITADVLTYRPMHTNSVAVTPQNCSFIGGSNKSMAELIYDPTGMRRFYEYVCLDKADFDAVNAIDAMAIFTSIDANRDRGYIEHMLPQLQQHQQQRQSDDEVQHFVKEMQLNEGETKQILAADLYSHFIIWRARAGYAAKHPMIITSFGMRLSSLGVKKEIKKIAGVQKTVYNVNAFSPVFASLPGPQSLKGNA